MTQTLESPPRGDPIPRQTQLSDRLDAVGWGLFFIWVGLSFLASLGWGIALMGVGVIALGEQAARSLYRIPVEGFWVFMGIAFLAAGAWIALGLGDGLIPVGFIALGCVIIIAGVRSKRPGTKRG